MHLFFLSYVLHTTDDRGLTSRIRPGGGGGCGAAIPGQGKVNCKGVIHYYVSITYDKTQDSPEYVCIHTVCAQHRADHI